MNNITLNDLLNEIKSYNPEEVEIIKKAQILIDKRFYEKDKYIFFRK